MNKGSRMLLLVSIQVILVPGPLAVATDIEGRMQAVGDIFGRRLLAQNSVAVRRQAAAKPRTERFETLKHGVLPHLGRPHFRLNGTFTQVSPAPPVADYSLEESARLDAAEKSDGMRVLVGGTLLSPAFDLVDVAWQQHRLDELRNLLLAQPVEELSIKGRRSQRSMRDSPAFRYDNRARLAMLALVELKAQRFPAAREYLSQLCLIGGQVPIRDPVDRWPEMLAFWRAVHHRETCDLVSETIYKIVFQDLHSGPGTGSEVWNRHLFALMGFQRLFEDPDAVTDDYYAPLTSKQWAGASFDMASLRGRGMPGARWVLRNRSLVHLCGQESDYVYFQSPMYGEFEVDCLTTTFDWREVQTFIAGRWAGPAWGMTHYELGDHRRSFRRPSLGTKMADEVGKFFHTRLTSKNGVAGISVNGRQMFSLPTNGNTDPWVGGRFWHRYHGGIRDVRITGSPSIPETLNLAHDRALTGWAEYYSTVNFDLLTNWSFTDGQIFGAATDTDHEGERLLRYHRPMLEDGEIEYEFFYATHQPNRFHVHPAIDRCAFVLKPDGVRIHWCTDGLYDQTELPFDNEFDEPKNRRGLRPLPLIDRGWNHLKLRWRDNVVDVILNDTLVYQRTLEVSNMRRFGFFFNPQQTAARIRNVRWTGDWPKQLPPLVDQDLADHQFITDLENSAKDLRTLTFDLRKTDRFPSEFEVSGSGVGPVISLESSADGLIVRESSPKSDEWNAAIVSFQGTLSGDFDTILEYSALRTAVAQPDEFPGICIHVDPQTDPVRKVENMVRHVAPNMYTVSAPSESARADGTTRWTSISIPRDATEGKLRVARRGDTVSFLFAPVDSDQFREFHTEPFSAADISPGHLQFRVISDSFDTLTEVTFRKITIAAERIRPAAAADAP